MGKNTKCTTLLPFRSLVCCVQQKKREDNDQHNYKQEQEQQNDNNKTRIIPQKQGQHCTIAHFICSHTTTLQNKHKEMSFLSNIFGGKKQAHSYPNMRPRSGSTMFNFMIFAASCTGGYVLFHSQRRELAALHAEEEAAATATDAVVPKTEAKTS
jgi:hypothetical protein